MLVKNHNFITKIKIKFEIFSKNRYCVFGKHIDFLKVPIFTKCDNFHFHFYLDFIFCKILIFDTQKDCTKTRREHPNI